jgi:hypothetical protein
MHYIHTTPVEATSVPLSASDHLYILSCHVNEYRKIQNNAVAEAVLCYWLNQEYVLWQAALETALLHTSAITVNHLCDRYRELKKRYDSVVNQKSSV